MNDCRRRKRPRGQTDSDRLLERFVPPGPCTRNGVTHRQAVFLVLSALFMSTAVVAQTQTVYEEAPNDFDVYENGGGADNVVYSSPTNDRYSFYDGLRASSASVVSYEPMFTSLPSGEIHVGRNLHRVKLATTDNEVDVDDILMCHIPIFLRYSDGQQASGIGTEIAYAGSVGALLAMHHFNTGNGTVIPELEGINKRCIVRLTTEVIDTASSGISAVQSLTSMLTRSPMSLSEPQPCAIFGSQVSAVTLRLASLAGAYDLPQVSSSAMDTALNNPVQYPTFARSHTDVAGFGEMSVSYLAENLGVKHAGLFVPNDSYGLSFQKHVLDAARYHGVEIIAVQYLETSEEDIIVNLRALKKTGFNYFIGAFDAQNFAKTMGLAYREGVAGPGRFWLASGAAGTAPALLSGSLTLETNSDAAKAIEGNGVIFCKGGLPGVGGSYDRFTAAWKDLGDPGALEYVNSKQPPPPLPGLPPYKKDAGYFEQFPNHIVTFSYDAIVGLGMAACEKAKMSGEETFSGKDHLSTFVGNTFRGASGDVEIVGQTRTALSSYFVMAAMTKNPINETHSNFKGSPIPFYYDTDPNQLKWKTFGGKPFVYSGNTTDPPQELPDSSEDMNHIQPAFRIIGTVLAAIGIFLAVGCAAATMKLRDNKVIKASQPEFLFLICVGCLLMVSTIIPLSIDDSVASEKGCSTACMAAPFLFFIGFTIAFSALFAKTNRINQLFDSAITFQRVQIESKDVVLPLVVLLTCNIVLLSVWAAVAPLEWSRTTLSEDQYGRPSSSIGRCTSDKVWAFLGPIIAINGLALIIALFEAYRARKIDTRYSEAKYIALAVLSIFQVTFIGIPLMFITRDDTTAYFFVSICIVFVTSMSTLLLIFAPKFYYVRTENWGGRRVSARWTTNAPVSVVGGPTGRSIPQERISSDDRFEDNVQVGAGRKNVLSATTSVQMEQYMEQAETGRSNRNIEVAVDDNDEGNKCGGEDGSLPRASSTDRDGIGLPTTTSVAMEEYMNESEHGPHLVD